MVTTGTFDPAALRGLYPWKGRMLDVGGGVRMHFLDEGAGDALVMLHGNPTWSFYFRHLVAGLSPTHRVIAPDHVGCGLSDKPGDDRYEYVLERRVRDLETLLDALAVTKNITLVLHDWGGMIGLAFATLHPDRVKRLIVLNTAGFGLPPGRTLPWQIAVIRRFPWFEFPVRGLNAFVRGAATPGICSVRPGRMTPLVRKAYLGPHDSWANRISVQRFVDDIPLGPSDRSHALVQRVADGIERFRGLPMVICWGRRDFVFDDAFLHEWERRFPAAEIHRFDDAGHFVLEDAHEEILPIVKDFLARHPLGAGAG